MSSRRHCSRLLRCRASSRPSTSADRGGARPSTERARNAATTSATDGQSSAARHHWPLQVAQDRPRREEPWPERGGDARVGIGHDVAGREHAGLRRAQLAVDDDRARAGRGRAGRGRARCGARGRSSPPDLLPATRSRAGRRPARRTTSSSCSPPCSDSSSQPARSSMRGSRRTCSTMSSRAVSASRRWHELHRRTAPRQLERVESRAVAAADDDDVAPGELLRARLDLVGHVAAEGTVDARPGAPGGACRSRARVPGRARASPSTSTQSFGEVDADDSLRQAQSVAEDRRRLLQSAGARGAVGSNRPPGRCGRSEGSRPAGRPARVGLDTRRCPAGCRSTRARSSPRRPRRRR